MSLKEHLAVEAAYGVIAEQLSVDIETAGRVLDGYASGAGRSLRDVATSVVERSLSVSWVERRDPFRPELASRSPARSART